MDLVGDGQTERPDLEPSSKADDAALDLIKQLITLASGVLALSATFIEKIGPLSWQLLTLLGLSWLSLIISVIGGIQTMSVIVKSRPDGNDTWSAGTGKIYGRVSKFGFVLGIALFVVFAFFLLIRMRNSDQFPIVL